MKTLCFFFLIFLLCLVSVRAANPAVQKFAACQTISAYASQAATLLHATDTDDNAPAVAHASSSSSSSHTALVQNVLTARDQAVERWKELVKTACSARLAWMWIFVALLAARRL
jgi:hypothetical protein